MSSNKQKEMKDKLKGTIEEAQGILTDDKKLELKGKARQNVGKARGVAGDLQHDAESMKDQVVGSVKEKAGELTDMTALEMKGKAQKAYGEADDKDKAFFGLGIVSILVLLIGLVVALTSDED